MSHERNIPQRSLLFPPLCPSAANERPGASSWPQRGRGAEGQRSCSAKEQGGHFPVVGVSRGLERCMTVRPFGDGRLESPPHIIGPPATLCCGLSSLQGRPKRPVIGSTYSGVRSVETLVSSPCHLSYLAPKGFKPLLDGLSLADWHTAPRMSLPELFSSFC